MKTKMRLATCSLLAALCTTVAAAQTYTITDLGTLPGFSSSLAYDNNNFGQTGQITGCSDNSVLPTLPCQGSIPADAFLWTNGQMQDLGHLSGDDFSVGYVVNDSGVVVGSSENTTTGVYRGFVWTSPGPMLGLPDLPGGSGYTFASAITSKGIIVGESATSKGDEHAVLWTKDSSGIYRVHNEGCLPQAPYCYGYDINETKQVTGVAYFFNNNTKYHAFLWSQAAGWKDLGTLPGCRQSIGEWLNNSGVVAGLCTTSKYPNGVSVYWDATGTHKIGTLSGGSSSWPGFITGSGVIVGQSAVADGTNHAYIWTQKTGMRDLNNMIPKNSGWVLNHAASVNKAGQIAGYGEINGVEHGFLLTPKP